jgi:hypothetical protein
MKSPMSNVQCPTSGLFNITRWPRSVCRTYVGRWTLDVGHFRSCTDLREALHFHYAGSVYPGPGEDKLVIILRNGRDKLGIINNARLERALYNH